MPSSKVFIFDALKPKSPQNQGDLLA